MFAKEAKVLPESDYYLYHPSTVASQIYLYVKEIGFFYYEPGYRRGPKPVHPIFINVI